MRKNILQIILAVIFLIIFFLMLYLVITKKIGTLDQFVYNKIAKMINPKNTKIMKFLTGFGSVFEIILIIFISMLFLKNNFDRTFLILGTLGEAAINNVIKILVKRPRPTINPLVIETSFSFPSGHTMAATALYLLLLFFLWKSSLPKEIKLFLTIIGIIIILCVALSRIYLGVHYFSDVIAGLCCSISYVLLITYFYSDLKHFF